MIVYTAKLMKLKGAIDTFTPSLSFNRFIGESLITALCTIHSQSLHQKRTHEIHSHWFDVNDKIASCGAFSTLRVHSNAENIPPDFLLACSLYYKTDGIAFALHFIRRIIQKISDFHMD